MQVRPLHDRILVKRLEGEQISKGGIILPDSAKEKPIEGKVIAVGKGKLLESGARQLMDIKEGDRILFGKYSGTELKIDGDDFLMLREDEVHAIIEA